MTVETSAPANIALIKYMGKIENTGNKPTNSSLSWTLENLRTFVRITKRDDLTQDQWRPLEQEGMTKMELSEKGVARFLAHFQAMKNQFGISGSFEIESANNFPSDCGLASSASSFAALTMASLQLFEKFNSQVEDLSVMERAEISRKGSGSSCRSFFGPWALWFSEGVRPVEFPMENLSHQVIVVENEKKEVSSSEAHKLVTTSPLFEGRPERAERRLAELMQALRDQDWQAAYQVTWDEFMDMHELFHTSTPSFRYINEASQEVLDYVKNIWNTEGDGPLVTMDAGPNVHLLYRADQAELAQRILRKMAPRWPVFESQV